VALIDHVALRPPLRGSIVEVIPREADGIVLSDHDGAMVCVELV
jgi:hypothetical protein